MSFSQEEIPAVPKTEIRTVDVEVIGETSPDEIAGKLATQETPGVIWIFFNENITEKLGAPRRYYNNVLLAQDVRLIQEYLNDRGYFHATIDTNVTYSNDARYVDIAITVRENARSYLDTVNFHGLEELNDQLKQLILNNSLLKRSDPFIIQNIQNEQVRVLKLLRNNGYPQAQVDSIPMRRYASTNNITINIDYNTGKKYTFGEIEFPSDHSEIENDVIVQQLDFSIGDVYNEESRFTSEQNLNRLGVFETISLRPEFIDDTSSAVPLKIFYRVLELQEVTPEFLVISENNELFSTGLGLGYKHRNFFGGARNLSLSIRGRINRIEDLNFSGAFASGLKEPTLFAKADIQSQLIFPYVYSNKTSANITLTAEAEKQPSYTLNTLRAKLGFVTKTATYTSLYTDFNIERVDPKFVDARNLRIEDTTKQFNIIEAFTLQRDKTNNIFSPTSGFFHSGAIEEAGLLSRSIGGLGLPYSEYIKVTLIAKQYLNFSEERGFVLALKLRSGVSKLYNPNNQTPVPLPRRFFAGGSNSIRGWKDKELAAFGDSIKGGNIALEGSVENRIQMFPNGGSLFKFLELDRVWSVLFLDYGNVWYDFRDVTVSSIAVAVGVGIRYETFVGPIRLDLAWRFYDPKQTDDNKYLTQQSFFLNSYSLIHLGIGHAF